MNRLGEGEDVAQVRSAGVGTAFKVIFGALVLFTALVGWVLASLMVVNFSANGGSRPMGIDELLIGVFPMAVLLAPLLFHRLAQRFGRAIAFLAGVLGVVAVAVGGIAITVIRHGSYSEDIQILAIIIGVWSVLGVLLLVPVRAANS